MASKFDRSAVRILRGSSNPEIVRNSSSLGDMLPSSFTKNVNIWKKAFTSKKFVKKKKKQGRLPPLLSVSKLFDSNSRFDSSFKIYQLPTRLYSHNFQTKYCIKHWRNLGSENSYPKFMHFENSCTLSNNVTYSILHKELAIIIFRSVYLSTVRFVNKGPWNVKKTVLLSTFLISWQPNIAKLAFYCTRFANWTIWIFVLISITVELQKKKNF